MVNAIEHVWSAFIWVRATCHACESTRTVRAESKRFYDPVMSEGNRSYFDCTALGAQRWKAISACECGSTFDRRLREINVTHVAHVACKGSCVSAKGIDCMCSCGGRNHGKRAV